MKFINKSRNLALTALLGAALSMSAPMAVAQGADNGNVPVPDDQNANTHDYQADHDLLTQYLDYVNSQAANYKEAYPELYDDVFAPTVDQIVSELQQMLAKVDQAKATADQDGSQYVSPVPGDFYQELAQSLQNLAEDAVWAQVSLAQDQVQNLGSALNGKIAELKALFDEKIASVVGEDAETFFLGEPLSDAILEDLQAMETKIAQAADEAEKVDYQRFVSPVTPEWISGIEQQILDYYDSCNSLILNAETNIELYKQDNESIDSLQESLDQAAAVVEEKFISVFGEDLDQEDKAMVTNAVGYNSLESQIEYLRQELAAASTEAKESNWQSYTSPKSIKNASSQLPKEITQYQKTALNRIDKARSVIRKHDQDISITIVVENNLGSTLKRVQTLYSDTLKDIIGRPTSSGEACFYYEEMFYAIQRSIDDMRREIVQAYNMALENYLESYDSPVGRDWRENLETQIEEYGNECELRINTALANLQLHDKDVEGIDHLEGLLAQAAGAISEKFNALGGDDAELSEDEIAKITNEAEFDSIQEKIEALRKAMTEEVTIAEADNWQSYSTEATGIEEAIPGLEARIAAYQAEGEHMVQVALGVEIIAHENDIAILTSLESHLMEALEQAQTLYAESLEEELGDADEAFFFNEKDFEAIQELIDKERGEVAKAYETASVNGPDSYQSPISQEWVSQVETKIQEYSESCEYRVNNALAQLQLFQEDLDMIQGLDSELFAAVTALQANALEKLGVEELTDEEEEFFLDEKTYNELAAQIDALRAKAVQAYDVAEADNWQNYDQEASGVKAQDQEIYEAILQYKDDCEYLANNAKAQMQLHEEDLEMVQGLDTELSNAVVAVQANAFEKLGVEELTDEEEEFFLDEKTYNELAAQIDALRQSIVEAYDAAEADNWQNYDQEASGVKAQAQEIYEAILQYKDDCEYLANNAQAQMQLHEEDLEMVQGLDTELSNAVVAVQANALEKLGVEELTDEEEEFFLDEKTYNELAAQIDALRQSIVEAYDAAEADNWQNYDQEASGVKAQAQEIYEAILQYRDDCEYLANNAKAQMQLHEEDLEMVQGLDSELSNAVIAVQANALEKLGVEELTDEEEEFFLDEKTYNELAAQIDALRQSIVEAYDAAEADNWQNYDQEASGVKAQAQEIYEAILKYRDDCEYLANNAQAQMQLHDEDVELVQALDTELFNAVVAIQELMQEKLGEEIEITDEMAAFFQDEEEFDQLQAQIDNLRSSVVAAYDKAEADNWQNYDQEASGVKENAQEIYEIIGEYKDECEYRVNNALANIQLHGEDVDMIMDLEASLQRAFDEVATEADENIDADILEGIRDFLVVDGYEEVLNQIEALRAAMVKQYDAAAADNWQDYKQQVVPNATAVDQAITQYQQESSERVMKALASIEAHQYDLDVLLPLDEILGDGIAELMEEHPELFEEGSEFIEQYEQLSSQIEEIWKEIAAAATEAEENNWQSYNSVFADTDIESLYAEVEDFLANAWGDVGTVNLHRWDADNNAVLQLESELVAAVDYIQQTNPEFDVDPEFDAIQAAIDALRHQMADAYQAADAVAWESYECPYTQGDLEAVEAMIDQMIAHAQSTSAIEGVNASDEQPMIFSIEGKRLNAPIQGELNIFIYKNRVEKKIVK